MTLVLHFQLHVNSIGLWSL